MGMYNYPACKELSMLPSGEYNVDRFREIHVMIKNVQLGGSPDKLMFLCHQHILHGTLGVQLLLKGGPYQNF